MAGAYRVECPHCHEDMGWFNHGICEKCGKYCGCSFNPTSSNDFCNYHRPKAWSTDTTKPK